MIINVPGINNTPSAAQIAVSDEVKDLTGAENVDDALKIIKNEGIKKELIKSIAITNGMTTLPSLQWSVDMIFKYSMLIFEFEGDISQNGAYYGYLYIYDSNSSHGNQIATLEKDSSVTYFKRSMPVVGADNMSNSRATANVIYTGGSGGIFQIRTDYTNTMAFSEAVSGSGTLNIYGVII